MSDDDINSDAPARFRFSLDPSGEWIEKIVLTDEPEIVCLSGRWPNDECTRDVLSVTARRKLQEIDDQKAWRRKSVAIMDEAIRTGKVADEASINLATEREMIVRCVEMAKMKRLRTHWERGAHSASLALADLKVPIKPTSFVSVVEAAISYSNRHGWEKERTFWRGLRDAIHFGDFDGRLKLYQAFDRPVIRSRFRSSDVDDLVVKDISEAELFEQLALLWLSRGSAEAWCKQMNFPVPKRWVLETAKPAGPGRPSKVDNFIAEAKRRQAGSEAFSTADAEAKYLVGEWADKEQFAQEQRPDADTLRKAIGKLRKKK